MHTVVDECPTWGLLTVITKAARFRAICELAAQYGLGAAALLLPYIPHTVDMEWNQGCQPSQLQGGEELWLCHQVLATWDLAL